MIKTVTVRPSRNNDGAFIIETTGEVDGWQTTGSSTRLFYVSGVWVVTKASGQPLVVLQTIEELESYLVVKYKITPDVSVLREYFVNG